MGEPCARRAMANGAEPKRRNGIGGGRSGSRPTAPRFPSAAFASCPAASEGGAVASASFAPVCCARRGQCACAAGGDSAPPPIRPGGVVRLSSRGGDGGDSCGECSPCAGAARGSINVRGFKGVRPGSEAEPPMTEVGVRRSAEPLTSPIDRSAAAPRAFFCGARSAGRPGSSAAGHSCCRAELTASSSCADSSSQCCVSGAVATIDTARSSAVHAAPMLPAFACAAARCISSPTSTRRHSQCITAAPGKASAEHSCGRMMHATASSEQPMRSAEST
mmetsp:Transcript_11103/g.36762  ORF Transcript_11103/g.36762 Transcript_11103/m.36762 type:complete len:277 (+) Transcript_11103:1903-2733(+)